MLPRTKRGKIILGGGICACLVVVVVLLLVFLLDDSNELDPPDVDEPLPPSTNATMGIYSKAAVVTNGYLCAAIGKNILLQDGNAVDAAVATLFCEGAMNLQSMGVGGGFLMTIYIKDSNQTVVINARETAPLAATEDMFHGDPSLSETGAMNLQSMGVGGGFLMTIYIKHSNPTVVINARDAAPLAATEDMFHGDPSLSETGALSVGIPGELRGYQYAVNKYGSHKVSWSQLVEPTIEILRNGFYVSNYIANILAGNKDVIINNEGLREFLVNPETGDVLKEGDLLRNPKLADTLQVVAVEGADAIYNGSLAAGFLKDIKDGGGIITAEDLAGYEPMEVEPVTARFANHTLYSVPVPGSGVVLAFILNILDGFLPLDDPILLAHRTIEAFKFAYGRRTMLGDISNPNFVPNATQTAELIANLTSPSYAKEIRKLISDSFTNSDATFYGAEVAPPEDHGTANMAVLGPNGDAVVGTSTINLMLGSKFVSKSTGIILNDEMDDFSSPNIVNGFGLPPSPTNFIHPGKRPLSSMCPSIFVDDHGDVSLLAGSAGGSRITTATAQMAIHHLLQGMTIKEALDAPRLHHQLFPMAVDYEYGILSSVIEGLKELGHETSRATTIESTATGIVKFKNEVTACYDFRRGGATDGF